MAEIVSKGQSLGGQRLRVLEMVIVAIAGAAIVLAIGWAVFVSSTPSAVAPAGSMTQYLQEPGLLDQRRGERSVDVSPAGGTLLDPAFSEHRRGERSGR
jgi:hypothetical protein